MRGSISFMCRHPLEFDLSHFHETVGKRPTYGILLSWALTTFELPHDRREIFRLMNQEGEELGDETVVVDDWRVGPLRLEYVPGHWDQYQMQGRREEPTRQDWLDAAEAGGVDVSAVPYGAAVASRIIRERG